MDNLTKITPQARGMLKKMTTLEIWKKKLILRAICVFVIGKMDTRVGK
jgi:hypothetical protein